MNGHCEVVLNKKRVASLCAALVVSGVLFSPGSGNAQNITMTDGGSTATLNQGGGTGNIGMNSWSVDVDPQSQLNQQWFWYSINGAVGQTIDTISPANVETANGNDGINTVVATYQNSLLSVEVEYVLSGNGVGSGSADIQESIMIQNTSSSSYNFNFFQYSDFNQADITGKHALLINPIGTEKRFLVVAF